MAVNDLLLAKNLWIRKFMSKHTSWRARHLQAKSAVCLRDPGSWMLTASGQRHRGRSGIPLLPAGMLGPAAGSSACTQRGRALLGCTFCPCPGVLTERQPGFSLSLSWDKITKIWHYILSVVLQVLYHVPVSDVYVVDKREFNVKTDVKIFVSVLS